MEFTQRIPFHRTELRLLENGLQVLRRRGSGPANLAVDIPYEELLPVRLDYEDLTPWGRLRPALVLLGLTSVQVLLRALHATQPAGGSPTLVLLGVVWVLVLVLFGLLRRYRWQHWVLRTARLRLHLADVPADRASIQQLAQALEQHTKTYLRQEYGSINPLGFIEPQLRRLRWLLELDVLTPAETRALTTRLTGRVSAEALRSMGQRLEPPYVN